MISVEKRTLGFKFEVFSVSARLADRSVCDFVDIIAYRKSK